MRGWTGADRPDTRTGFPVPRERIDGRRPGGERDFAEGSRDAPLGFGMVSNSSTTVGRRCLTTLGVR